MPVKDSETVKFTGWPAGINNVQPEHSVPRDALRAAVNVQLDGKGKPSGLRTGYVLRHAGASHSLYAAPGALLGVKQGVLTAYEPGQAGAALVTGFGVDEVSYATVNGEVYWADASRAGRISGTLQAQSAWTPCPGQPTVTAYASGGMSAGTYQVATTWLDATGRESGSTLASLVVVPAGGGIEVTNIPPNAQATTIRFYVSGANGDPLLWANDAPAATTTFLIAQGARGKQLETQWLEPLDRAHHLCLQNGRLYSAFNNVLRWSPPFAYGLTHPDDYVVVDENITMLASVGDGPNTGMFIGTDKVAGGGSRTYFAKGDSPKNWSLTLAHGHGAVPRSLTYAPGSVFGLSSEDPVPYWLTRNGLFCYGAPDGRVVPLTRDRFVALQDGTSAASILRESNGFRQLITAMLGGATNAMRATDSASATVRRHGATT
jgi:hypothetical protein